MKHALVFFVSMFISVMSYGQRPTISGFTNADRYDQEGTMRTNPDCKGVSIVDTFRTNCPGLEFLTIDKASDLAFLAKFVKEFPPKYRSSNAMETSDTSHYLKVPLKSGATLIISKDPAYDRRVFLSFAPNYYFIMTEHLLWFYCKKNPDGSIMGRTDGFRIESDPVAVIKELLYTRPLVVKN